MGFFVGGPQASGAHVGVDLRGDQAFMAEQFLDAANVGPSVEQVRGETMPQGVGRSPQVEPRLLEVLLQHPSHAAGGDSLAKFVGEGGRFGLRGCRLADRMQFADREPVVEGRLGKGTNRC